MAASFIDSLPVGPEEKSLFRARGINSAAELLGLIQSSPDFFERQLGKSRLAELVSELKTQLSTAHHAVLDTPVKKFATGAIIDEPAPELKSPRFDLNKRDALFERLTELEKQDRTQEVDQEIQAVTEQLNAMLDQH